MKRKVCLTLLIVLILNLTSGCVFDEELSTKKEMEEYAKEYIAKDAVVDSVSEVKTGLKGNMWTLYLKRDPSKKFIVYEYISDANGIPFKGRYHHSNFAYVWIKDLYDEYIINNSAFDNIDAKFGTGVYCENCGGLYFRIDCKDKEAKEKAIENFASYVQNTGIAFQNNNTDFGYDIICSK